MVEEDGELEKISLKVEGVVCGSNNPRGGKRAYIKTERPLENSLWSLAMKAGYTFRDKVEYEITVRRKAE